MSGAVLLLPVQVSILNVPSPGVTPTNVLYNVIATPGGLWRYWRTGALSGPLARTLVAGTLPGVVIGAVRVPLRGGSILSPILLSLGYSVFDVAGAALAATFLTSVAGILPTNCCNSTRAARSPRSGRSGSRWAQAGWRAPISALGCSRGCQRPSFAARSG